MASICDTRVIAGWNAISHAPVSLLLFLACLILPVFFLLRTSRRSASALPPGPLSLPIVGHLHLLRHFSHQWFHKLAKVHGPLIWLRFGSVPVIVASTPETAREILQRNDSAFASRPSTSAGVYALLGRSSVSVAPNGSFWRLMRQILVKDLLGNKGLEAFRPIREEAMIALLQSIWKDSNEGAAAVPLRPRISYAVHTMIAPMMFGKKFSELTKLADLLGEIFSLMGVIDIGDFAPFLQWMDLQGYVKRAKIAGESLRTSRAFQEIIDDRRQLMMENPTFSPKSLLDLLLSVSQKSQLDKSQSDVQTNDDYMKAFVTSTFGGGTRTTVVAVEWALAELLRNPAIMKKLQDEIESTVGSGRLLRESDVAELPYLRAVVKETMRLHPPGPLALPHESTKPCVVAGYHIPAKTVAFVNVWAIGRDPSVWEKPLKFWPERFLNSDIDVRGHHFELLPFTAGRRQCPGWTLGLMNVQVILGSLVQAFEWSQIDSVDMSEGLEKIIVPMSKPLVARATPRFPAHLYGC